MESTKKLKIGVIRWGIGTEREVSLASGQEIISQLNPEKYEVIDLVFDAPKELIIKLQTAEIEFAYLALHGKFGEDGNIQAILEGLEIPYLGSGVLSSALGMDKDISKRVLKSYDIRTPQGKSIRKGEICHRAEVEKFWLPLVIKPNTGGSSVGVHFVTTPEELSEVLEEIFQIDEEALIEETISGTEISVPIIDGIVYPAIKIEPLLGEFFDYQSKYAQGGSKETIYEYPNEKLKAEIEEFTKMTYYALKCRGPARVDMMIRDHQAYVLEINTLPGMTATSLLPKSLLSQGKNYAEVVELLINSSIKRLEILVEAS